MVKVPETKIIIFLKWMLCVFGKWRINKLFNLKYPPSGFLSHETLRISEGFGAKGTFSSGTCYQW